MAGHDELLDKAARVVLGLSQAPNERTSSSKEKLKSFSKSCLFFTRGCLLLYLCSGRFFLGLHPQKEPKRENMKTMMLKVRVSLTKPVL